MISSSLLERNHHEHSPVAVFAGSLAASRAVAQEIATLIRARNREGRACVLGLATGSTPVSLYAELVRLHREEGLSFGNVTTNTTPSEPNSPRAIGTSCAPIFSIV